MASDLEWIGSGDRNDRDRMDSHTGKRRRRNFRGKKPFRHFTPRCSKGILLDVKKDTFDVFMEEAKSQGVSVFALIRDFLDRCADEMSNTEDNDND